jgi:HEPN domain-containing protein
MATIAVAGGDRAKATMMWIRWAEADYVAARILLRMGLLVQGAALANTAIEKFLKAIFEHAGLKVPHSHNVNDLYAKIKSTKKQTLTLNEDFLRLLAKSYMLRYPDDVGNGFNMILSQSKMLAQLDRSVKDITDRFRIVANDKPVPMVLERAIQQSDPRYLDLNIAVDPKSSTALFGTTSGIYEIRKLQGSFLEANYKVASLADDLVFDTVGFTPNPHDATKF